MIRAYSGVLVYCGTTTNTPMYLHDAVIQQRATSQTQHARPHRYHRAAYDNCCSTGPFFFRVFTSALSRVKYGKLRAARTPLYTPYCSISYCTTKLSSPVEGLPKPRGGHFFGEVWRHDMPTEGVPLDGHVLGSSPVDKLVAGSEIVHPLRGEPTSAAGAIRGCGNTTSQGLKDTVTPF